MEVSIFKILPPAPAPAPPAPAPAPRARLGRPDPPSPTVKVRRATRFQLSPYECHEFKRKLRPADHPRPCRPPSDEHSQEWLRSCCP